jgi:hypothetical protein
MSKLRLYYDFDIDCLRNNILSEIDANDLWILQEVIFMMQTRNSDSFITYKIHEL